MNFDERKNKEIQKNRIKLILVLLGLTGSMALYVFIDRFLENIGGDFSI